MGHPTFKRQTIIRLNNPFSKNDSLQHNIVVVVVVVIVIMIMMMIIIIMFYKMLGKAFEEINKKILKEKE